MTRMEPGRHAGRSWTLVCALGCLASMGALPALGAGGAVSPAAPTRPGDAAPAALLSPTLGRPVFVPPGGTFQVVAQWPPSDDALSFRLVSERFPAYCCDLAAPEDAAERLARGDPVMLRVPDDVPPRTYDLEIRGPEASAVGRHCVAVGALGRRLRLVHLSNMNVGELGTPEFDWRLVTELNLVAPTLIVATGDFLDVTHEDPAAGWEQLVQFFAACDAPALIACGDHDELAWYSRHVAPSPVGVVELDWARGVVLYDLPSQPVSADADQMRWFEQLLTNPGDDRLTFVVAHDDCPNLLRAWQEQGRLAEMVAATRLGLWFAGGHRDWDGREYRDLIMAAEPLLYVRTHEASTATRGGAAGVSHYRIVDVEGERATVVGAAGAGGLPPSLPVGRLRVDFDGPNDGSRPRVSLTATNGHAFRVDGLRARVLVAGAAAQRPWCVGAALTDARRIDGVWECEIRFGLPDKGALRAVVGTGSPPELPAVEVLFDVEGRLVLTRRETPDGIAYWSYGGQPLLVHLVNRETEPVTVTPLLRLDGETLAYVVLDAPGPPATGYRVRLAPGQTLTLQPDLSAIRVAPGRRELQVYLKGPPAWAPACCALDIVAP